MVAVGRCLAVDCSIIYDIVENKIANEAQKAIIRNYMPPQIAERMLHGN